MLQFVLLGREHVDFRDRLLAIARAVDPHATVEAGIGWTDLATVWVTTRGSESALRVALTPHLEGYVLVFDELVTPRIP